MFYTNLTYLLYNIVERDELRKDIEQLCMHQGGPGYLAVVTRMHFQRYMILFRSPGKFSHFVPIMFPYL